MRSVWVIHCILVFQEVLRNWLANPSQISILVSKFVQIVNRDRISDLEGNNAKRVVLTDTLLFILFVFRILVRNEELISFQLINLPVFWLMRFSTLFFIVIKLWFLRWSWKDWRNLKKVLEVLFALSIIISSTILRHLDLDRNIINERKISKDGCLYHMVYLPVTVKRVNSGFLILSEDVDLFTVSLLDWIL